MWYKYNTTITLLCGTFCYGNGKSNRDTVIVIKRVFSLAKTIVVDVFVIYIPRIPVVFFVMGYSLHRASTGPMGQCSHRGSGAYVARKNFENMVQFSAFWYNMYLIRLCFEKFSINYHILDKIISFIATRLL